MSRQIKLNLIYFISFNVSLISWLSLPLAHDKYKLIFNLLTNDFLFPLKGQNISQNLIYWDYNLTISRPGVGKLRPAGRIRPACDFEPARLA